MKQIDVSLYSEICEHLNFSSDNIKDYNGFFTGTGGAIFKAKDYIENYCRQNVNLKDNTVIFDGNGMLTMFFNRFPINSVSKLYERNDDFTYTEITDFYFYEASGIYYIEKTTVFSLKKKYKIIYNSGYTDIPNDLYHLAMEMCFWDFKESNLNPDLKGGLLGIQSRSESFNGITNTTTYSDIQSKWNKELMKFQAPPVFGGIS